MENSAYAKFNLLSDALFKCVDYVSNTTMEGLDDEGRNEICRKEAIDLQKFLDPNENQFK